MTNHTELLARHREQWSGEKNHGLAFGNINDLVEMQAAAIRDLTAQIAALERGEFICKKCGLRKDGEHEKGDF